MVDPSVKVKVGIDFGTDRAGVTVYNQVGGEFEWMYYYYILYGGPIKSPWVRKTRKKTKRGGR